MRSRFSTVTIGIAGALMRFPRGLRPGLKLVSVVLAVALLTACAVLSGSQVSSGPSAEVDMSNDPKHSWGEPVIAVNPKNPDNLVAAVNVGYICKTPDEQACQQVPKKGAYGLLHNMPGFSEVVALVSFDRGKTWKHVPMPSSPSGHPDIVLSSHPTAGAAADGTFYIAYNAMHGSESTASPLDYGGIGVTRSSDGGNTWSPPVLVGTPIDHPYITTDLSTGKVYVSSGGGQVVLGPMSKGDPNATPGTIKDRWLVSTSDGIHWTTPQPFVGYDGFGFGASFVPFIAAARGELAAAFRAKDPAICGAGVPVCTVFETTKDAGAHWSKGTFPAPTTYDSGALMAADPLKAGHFTMALLMNSGAEFDVYNTNDSGKTWSGPKKITDDANKTHFHGWMAYSPKGVLSIMWKTREAPPTTEKSVMPSKAPYNVWAVISRDGGGTFSEPLKITTAASPGPVLEPLSTVAVGPQEVFLCWGDLRAGEMRSLFSAVKLDAFKSKH